MVESSGTSQQPLPPPRVSCCKPPLTLLHHTMTLQHLLVPVDFSERTPATLALAVRLAGKFSTHVLKQMNPQACLSLSRFSDLPTAQLASGAPEVSLRTSCAVEYAVSPNPALRRFLTVARGSRAPRTDFPLPHSPQVSPRCGNLSRDGVFTPLMLSNIGIRS
jgi:hypothetical protein